MFRPPPPCLRSGAPSGRHFSRTSVNSAHSVSPSLGSPLGLFVLLCKKSAKSNPSFSYSSPLLKKECYDKSFTLNNFRTLLQNTRGGIPLGIFSFNLELFIGPEPVRTVSSLFDFSSFNFNVLALSLEGSTFSPSHSLVPNPFRITSFADSNHLTPVESNLYKKQGGGSHQAAQIVPLFSTEIRPTGWGKIFQAKSSSCRFGRCRYLLKFVTSLPRYFFTSSLVAWNKCLARASSQVQR